MDCVPDFHTVRSPWPP